MSERDSVLSYNTQADCATVLTQSAVQTSQQQRDCHVIPV